MSEQALTVRWTSPLALGYNLGLSSIAKGIASKAGGYVNNVGEAADGHYYAVVYVPKMIQYYCNLLGSADFTPQLVDAYYTEKYQMTNVTLEWSTR